MRFAIVSDIHGNRTAFESVLRDLRETAPDLVLHGGDLSDAGASPVEIVDHIRDLKWQGVFGNTDEMLFDPASLDAFFGNPPRMPVLVESIREMADWTRAALGEERIAWLRGLPRNVVVDDIAIVHASPATTWRAPDILADDGELESTYSPLGRAVVIYGHTHKPGIRHTERITVINAGSAGMPYDGDPRASYVLIDDARPGIRRVDYDVAAEIGRLRSSGMPHQDWLIRTLQSASPQPL